MGFKVTVCLGLGFKVWGLGLNVIVLGFRVQGFEVWGLRVQCF